MSGRISIYLATAWVILMMVSGPAWSCPDNDGDGYAQGSCGGTDCNDAYPDVWLVDADGDGEPNAYCGPYTDCYDNDPSLQTIDKDGDGLVSKTCPPWLQEIYGTDPNDNVSTLLEDNDGDGHYSIATGGDDCDDNDSNRFPGNVEVCDAADHDEDCDYSTFGFRDADGDGFADLQCANEAPDGTRYTGTDCDDFKRWINPITSEVCNGYDDNCDGAIDEGVTMPAYQDNDEDGYGTTWVADVCPAIVLEAANWSWRAGDCDDANPGINPGQPESCNGQDDNCNGTLDEGLPILPLYHDNDLDGYGGTWAGEFCTGPFTVDSRLSTQDGDCDDTRPFVYPGAPEFCNLVDDDCDGDMDENLLVAVFEDLDGDGFGGNAVGESCADAILGHLDLTAVEGDCDDVLSSVNPDAPEACNGVDDNCDSQIDEGFSGLCE